MAERSNFKAVMLFTTFNVLIYALPAHWMWSETGWLRSLGARDIAGAGMVHMLGGFSGLIGSYFVGNNVHTGSGQVMSGFKLFGFFAHSSQKLDG